MIYKAADATITFEEIVVEITVAKILRSRLLGIKFNSLSKT